MNLTYWACQVATVPFLSLVIVDVFLRLSGQEGLSHCLRLDMDHLCPTELLLSCCKNWIQDVSQNYKDGDNEQILRFFLWNGASSQLSNGGCLDCSKNLSCRVWLFHKNRHPCMAAHCSKHAWAQILGWSWSWIYQGGQKTPTSQQWSAAWCIPTRGALGEAPSWGVHVVHRKQKMEKKLGHPAHWRASSPHFQLAPFILILLRICWHSVKSCLKWIIDSKLQQICSRKLRMNRKQKQKCGKAHRWYMLLLLLYVYLYIYI